MKSIQDYAAEPIGRTQRLAEFIKWVEDETGLAFTSRVQREAFERGLCLGVRGYGLFQADRRHNRKVPRGRAHRRGQTGKNPKTA